MARNPSKPRVSSLNKCLVAIVAPAMLLSASVFAAENNGQKKDKEKVNVSGEWEIELEGPVDDTKPRMFLKQAGSKVTGNYQDEESDKTIVLGDVKGSEVTLIVVAFVEDEDNLIITYRGTVADNSIIKGEVEFKQDGNDSEREKGPFTLTKIRDINQLK
jgi:hypothetical protein